jgi:hypothetical protein
MPISQINVNSVAANSLDSSNMDSTSQYYGFKNRIINGAMVIDQRNAGSSITPTNGQFSVDRWQFSVSQSSKLTAQQSSTAPAGFTKSLLVTSSSAYSVSSSDYFGVFQSIEGLNMPDVGFGAAGASNLTLSFWVRSSLTGTFGGVLTNYANNRTYPFSYTINSANTFEQKTITIAGDTSGTWLTTNSGWGQVWFGLGVGSTYSGAANSWAGSAYYSSTGATSVVGTNGATFYITGVQLEKGSTATSFDYRPYGTELMLCQRYYGTVTTTVPASSATYVGYIYAKATMRTTPTFVGGSGFTPYASDANGCAAYQSTGLSGQLVTMSAEL